MKYIRYIAAIIALGLFASHAEAQLGSFVINLTATQQSLAEAETSKTNITATTTNIVTVDKWTTTNTVINNARILKMLANSFNTNLPANAVLKINPSEQIVVAVGTNIVLNASSVISIAFSGSPAVDVGSATSTTKTTPTATIHTQNIAIVDTTIDTFTYNDSGKSTADGRTTNFQVQGYRTLKLTSAFLNINGTVTVNNTVIETITGAGKGTISGKGAVLKGLIVGTSHPIGI